MRITNACYYGLAFEWSALMLEVWFTLYNLRSYISAVANNPRCPRNYIPPTRGGFLGIYYWNQ